MGSLQSKNNTPETSISYKFSHYAPILGTALIIGGLLLFIDQRIHTGWIPISLPVFVGLIILVYGFILRHQGFILAGFVITGLSGALFMIFQPFINIQTNLKIAFGLVFFGLNWLGVLLVTGILKKKILWWTLFIITICFALSIIFFLKSFTVLTFVFGLSLAIGSSLLGWGVFNNVFSLQIAGLLVITIGVGIYKGWNTVGDINGLRDTGNMLVWFSLGWILITVFSRIFKKKFIWWPLIPGGILAMVGSGLYIGGNPENAAAFLQNTGSIGLVLLGIYLILLKFGLKK
jgi:hypothetical protein